METPPPIPDPNPAPVSGKFTFAKVADAATVYAGALCRGCGYELTGLSAEGHCPECGKPIAESLKGDRLLYAPAQYLQSLHRGTITILASILFYVVGSLASGIAGFAMAASMGTVAPAARTGSALAMQSTVAAFGVGISVFYSILSIAGWYWFTEQDQGVGVLNKADSTRKLVRSMAIANGVCGILSAIAGLFGLGLAQSFAFGRAGGANSPGPSLIILAVLAGLVGLAVFVLWVIQFFASLNYMAWLIGRLPDEPMRQRALKYRWMLPLIFILGYACLGLGPLIALVMYYNLINQMRIIIRNIRVQRGDNMQLFDRLSSST